jgi:hypothetical protein
MFQSLLLATAQNVSIIAKKKETKSMNGMTLLVTSEISSLCFYDTQIKFILALALISYFNSNMNNIVLVLNSHIQYVVLKSFLLNVYKYIYVYMIWIVLKSST